MNKGLLLPLMTMLVVFTLGCFPGVALSQEGPPIHRVQAVVEGLASTRHAARADLILRDRPGVLMSRTDLGTSNLFMHVTPDCPLDEAAINGLLAPLQLSVRCLRREAASTGPFRHLGTGPCGLEIDTR